MTSPPQTLDAGSTRRGRHIRGRCSTRRWRPRHHVRVPSPRPRADARPARRDRSGLPASSATPTDIARTERQEAVGRDRLGPGQPRADVVGRVREHRMRRPRRPVRCREASAATPPAPWSRWSAARPPDRDRRRRAAESAPRRQPSGGQEFRTSAGSRDRPTPPSAPAPRPGWDQPGVPMDRSDDPGCLGPPRRTAAAGPTGTWEAGWRPDGSPLLPELGSTQLSGHGPAAATPR